MELLTAEAMAKVLDVSPKSLYRWVKLGKIPYIKLERHLRFQPDIVIEHFKARTEGPVLPCFPSEMLLKNQAVGRKSPSSLTFLREGEAARSYSGKG